MPTCETPLYESMPSDVMFPEPAVIETESTPGRDNVGIIYSVHTLNGKSSIVRLDTSDEGEHWTKSYVRKRETKQEKQFGSLIYEVGNDSRFRRSEDGGKRWEYPKFRIGGRQIQPNEGAAINSRFIFSTALPGRPTTVYGCFESAEAQGSTLSPFPAGLYVSFDAGDNWSLVTDQIQNRRLGEGCLLGISPSNPNTMIAHGSANLIISHDSGKRWATVGGAEDLERPAELKGYAKNLAALKQKGLVAAKEWPFEWTYLTVAQIKFLPSDQNVAFLVTNKGLYRTDDGARTWCLLDTGPHKLFDVRSIYIDQMHKGRIYVGTNFRLLQSDDLGCHFRTIFDWQTYSHRQKKTVEGP